MNLLHVQALEALMVFYSIVHFLGMNLLLIVVYVLHRIELAKLYYSKCTEPDSTSTR